MKRVSSIYNRLINRLNENPNIEIVRNETYLPEYPFSNFSDGYIGKHIHILPKKNFSKIDQLDTFFRNIIPQEFHERESVILSEEDSYKQERRFRIPNTLDYMNSYAEITFDQEMAKIKVSGKAEIISKHCDLRKYKFRGDEEKEISIFEHIYLKCYPSREIYDNLKQLGDINSRGKKINELRSIEIGDKLFLGVIDMRQLQGYGLSY